MGPEAKIGIEGGKFGGGYGVEAGCERFDGEFPALSEECAGEGDGEDGEQRVYVSDGVDDKGGWDGV